MASSNAVLSEYYGQTKGSNIMLSSDDFWYGALFGSMFGGNGKGDNGGCSSCFGCILIFIGIFACFTGNLGLWCCGIKDFIIGTCSYCLSCSSMGPGYDAGAAGCDQACDGLSAICCLV